MIRNVLVLAMVGALSTVAACNGGESDQSSATIPAPTTSPPTTLTAPVASTVAISGKLAMLLETDAVIRIVDEESGRDPENDPFREIVVASAIGGDTERPVESGVVDLLGYGGRAARFTDDPDAEIAGLEAAGTTDVAIVVVDDLRRDGEGAEIDVHMWCGTCDVAVTYVAEMGPERFMITGTID